MKTLSILQLTVIILSLIMAAVNYFTEDVTKAIWYLLMALINYILWRDFNEKK